MSGQTDKLDLRTSTFCSWTLKVKVELTCHTYNAVSPVSFCAKCSGFCVLTFLNRSQLFSQQSLAFELLQILHHCDADLRL